MVLDRESRRRESRKIAGACVDVEDPLALATLEMMMVVAPGELEARVLRRQHHRLQLALVDERLEVAVDRCDAEAWHFLPGSFEYLMRQQGAVGLRERVADGLALTGIALHDLMLTEGRPASRLY
jgi:hypothetical protein